MTMIAKKGDEFLKISSKTTFKHPKKGTDKIARHICKWHNMLQYSNVLQRIKYMFKMFWVQRNRTPVKLAIQKIDLRSSALLDTRLVHIKSIWIVTMTKAKSCMWNFDIFSQNQIKFWRLRLRKKNMIPIVN